jgi:molecular chaperone DnaJ
MFDPKTLNKEQKQFFEKNLMDENFIPKPEKSDKSFLRK